LWFAKIFFLIFDNNFADLIARLHIASCKFMYTVSVSYTLFNLRVLVVLNSEGIIEGFKVIEDSIIVNLKYNFLNKLMLFKNTKLISTPGRRQYWSLAKLNKVYGYNNFAGFYLLSTNKGIVTSHDALLKLHSGGEILLKITI
jgi:ribosomal protein S8